MRTLLCRALIAQKVGSVTEAASAEDAVEALRRPENEINLVLCDWNLPHISGLEFSRLLKSQKPIMPIVMITGRGDADSVGLARGAGIDGYIVKPVTPRELIEKIEATVRRTWEKRVGGPHGTSLEHC